MPGTDVNQPISSPYPEDIYLTQFLGAMALECALRTGMIDGLEANAPMPDQAGLLLTLLDANDVTENGQLTPAFQDVLRTRRDILEEKLAFLKLSALDVVTGLGALAGDLPQFMGRSETFALFRYDKADNTGPTALHETRKWVRYVSALTAAEAPYLVPHLPFENTGKILEIGGNAGAFAREILKTFAELEITILDLPAVCALGEEDGPTARLSFLPGDARKDPLSMADGTSPDAILFKSVLHDWPLEHTSAMLARATEHLPPGGQLVICERGPFKAQEMPFYMTANVVFAPFYRDEDVYLELLGELGYREIRHRPVMLEMPFNIIHARKP